MRFDLGMAAAAALAMQAPAMAAEDAGARHGGAVAVGPAAAGYGAELRIGGRAVPGVEGVAIEVEAVWQLDGEDLLLLHVYSGGNGVCADHKQLVLVAPDGPAASPPFAHCALGLADARVTGGSVAFDVEVVDPRIQHVTYTYADGELTGTPVPRGDTAGALPGGGASVTRWAGALPWELLEDPAERRRFLEVMPQESLFELQERVEVASPMTLSDGWLVASGCMSHSCGSEAGTFAIEVATGRVIAAIRSEGAETAVFGGDAADELRGLVSFGIGRD